MVAQPTSGFGEQIVQRRDIHIKVAQSSVTNQSFIMGFADLSIAEIAADYHLPVEEVLALCKQLGISFKSSQTRLALEDAKSVISQILASQEHPSGHDGTEGVRS